MIILCDKGSLNYFKSLGYSCFDFSDISKSSKDDNVLIFDEKGIMTQSDLYNLVLEVKNLHYIGCSYFESNAKYLMGRGCNNIYKIPNRSYLTVERIETISIEVRSKEEAISDIGDVINSHNIGDKLELMDSLIRSIEIRDKIKIETCIGKLEDLMSLKSDVESRLLEHEKMKRELERTEEELKNEIDDLNSLKDKYENLVDSGFEVENLNKQLVKNVESLKYEILEKDNQLQSKDDSINETLSRMQLLSEEINDLRNSLDAANIAYDKATRENSKLIKDLSVLGKNVSKSSLSDLYLKITNRGKIEKILYIKVLDPVPHIVSSLKEYTRHLNGKTGNAGACILLIVNEGSTIYKKYKNVYKNITELNLDENANIDMNKNIYILDGFKLEAEKFIKLCNCKLFIVIDMTFKVNILANCSVQTTIYIVNSKNTIELNGINPRNCISFNSLVDEGVNCKIPELNKEEINNIGKRLLSLKNNLYIPLDAKWGV